MTKTLARVFYDLCVVIVSVVIIFIYPVRILYKWWTRDRSVISIWAGVPIINMALNSKSERMLNVNAKSIVYSTYYITNDFDIDLSGYCSIPVLGRLIPLMTYLYYSIIADRFHFYFDRGLLPGKNNYKFQIIELYVYRILGIDVFMWAYGADVRSKSITLAAGEPNCCTNCDNHGYYCGCDDATIDRIEKICSLTTAQFSGVGDMFDYIPGANNHLYYWPVDLTNPKYSLKSEVSESSVLKIVHSTNHRIFKGTEYIINAVDKLKNEGYEISLELVEKCSNEKAMNTYRTADVIFDQCLMGNYGFFAVEAMAIGKPVMCFIRKPDEYLLSPGECPIININIHNLVEKLRYYMENRGELAAIGLQGRKYIEKYYTLDAFAARLDGVYKEIGIAQ